MEELKTPTINYQLSLADLPTDVMLIILQYLSPEMIAVCAETHPTFANIIEDIHFLDVHTRKVLGFPKNQTDITFKVVPPSLSPLQDLWYQTYLTKSCPNLVGLIRPGNIFYDLLNFQHLMDSWLLQATGFRYSNFIYHILNGIKDPPLPISKIRESVKLNDQVKQVLTKIALCHPEFLLMTINNFEILHINSTFPSDLISPWENEIPPEAKSGCVPINSVEIVTRQGDMGWASLFLVFEPTVCIGWTGIVDYSTHRCKQTWSTCYLNIQANIDEIRSICEVFLQIFLEYINMDYISVHSVGAFFFPGLCRMIKDREPLIGEIQESLENIAVNIGKKVKSNSNLKECKNLTVFLDSVRLIPSAAHNFPWCTAVSQQNSAPSKTLEVSIQRYIHRILNYIMSVEVLRLYSYPACHQLLCSACQNMKVLNQTLSQSCLERINHYHLPFRIWPPHLLVYSISMLQTLGKIVLLEIERWQKGLHNCPLSEKMKSFIKGALQTVHLDFHQQLGYSGFIVPLIRM